MGVLLAVAICVSLSAGAVVGTQRAGEHITPGVLPFFPGWSQKLFGIR